MSVKNCTNCGFRLSELGYKLFTCTNSFCKDAHTTFTTMKKKEAKERLEYLRQEIEAERISYGETFELQSLVKYIEPDDVLLLEWAGVSEEEYMKGLEK